ncbi:MAG: hypothetical protein H0T89_10855 [Deltaproteobacteria bacterium]|nr:hypothetical protein [Deltaproteobacteria bacterium]MDQ3299934.1 hypothetical protein [Myxococcota bacterium]
MTLRVIAMLAVLAGCGNTKPTKEHHDPRPLVARATLDTLRYLAATGEPKADNLLRELITTLCALEGHPGVDVRTTSTLEIYDVERAEAASAVTCGALIFPDGTRSTTAFWKKYSLPAS